MSAIEVDTIRDLYTAFERRDLDTIRAAIPPDFTMWQSELLPWGGHRRGPDGFFAFLGSLLSYVESNVEISALYSSGQHVVQMGHTTGTVHAHGNTFRVPEVHIWQVRAGRPVSYEVHLDTPAMLAALRGEPAPA
jgi:ketosteroid isomerase-like protein